MALKLVVLPQYGRWTVIGAPFRKFPTKKSKRDYSYILVRCECGTENEVRISDLNAGKSHSCGCLAKELSKIREATHGLRNHRLYYIWSGMKARCYNPKSPQYPRYGGRGIRICDEWRNDFKAFYDWCMANGHDKSLQIDRINNDGNYEPSNCRWATIKEQARNKSDTKLSVDKAAAIRKLHKTGRYTNRQIGKLYGVHSSNIYYVVNNKTWQ